MCSQSYSWEELRWDDSSNLRKEEDCKIKRERERRSRRMLEYAAVEGSDFSREARLRPSELSETLLLPVNVHASLSSLSLFLLSLSLSLSVCVCVLKGQRCMRRVCRGKSMYAASIGRGSDKRYL
jgi:hypothetical protein